MNRNYYDYDEELTPEELQAREEWNNYVRTVDELDRKTHIQNRILAATFIIIIVIILVLIFKGSEIASMIS